MPEETRGVAAPNHGRRGEIGLAALPGFLNAPAMQSHPHRGRKLRRFARNHRNQLFVGFFLILILALVAAIFWVLTDARFIIK